MCRLLCCLIVGCALGCNAEHSEPEVPLAGRDGGAAGARAAGGSSGAGGRDARAAAPSDDAGEPDDAGVQTAPLRVYVFSRTTGYRHDSITPAQAALRTLAEQLDASMEVGEDPAALIGALAETDVVVFLMTTGDVLDDAQQTAFERYIRGGGGYVGIHSAADTEYDWPFYGSLVGAWFKDHGEVQKAKVLLDAPQSPLVAFLPAIWERTDEWYAFRENPRGKVDVLLTLDDSTLDGGTMGGDHPIAWSHRIDQGRAFYTGIGHTVESWQETLVLRHVEAGLLWAAGE